MVRPSQLTVDGALMAAYRASWVLLVGPIPGEQVVCHRCDDDLCINPGHLFLGTAWDNRIDMLLKFRHGGSIFWEGVASYVCPGHEYTGEGDGAYTPFKCLQICRRCLNVRGAITTGTLEYVLGRCMTDARMMDGQFHPGALVREVVVEAPSGLRAPFLDLIFSRLGLSEALIWRRVGLPSVSDYRSPNVLGKLRPVEVAFLDGSHGANRQTVDGDLLAAERVAAWNTRSALVRVMAERGRAWGRACRLGSYGGPQRPGWRSVTTCRWGRFARGWLDVLACVDVRLTRMLPAGLPARNEALETGLVITGPGDYAGVWCWGDDIGAVIAEGGRLVRVREAYGWLD
jgi:hypothetical protein